MYGINLVCLREMEVRSSLKTDSGVGQGRGISPLLSGCKWISN